MLIILEKILLVFLVIFKIIILVIIGIYFGLRKITPNIPILKKISKNKFIKYLHKILPWNKPKINLVLDLDGTLIKSSKFFTKNQK